MSAKLLKSFEPPPAHHGLDWYRIGNEISDRQWSEVVGVLKLPRGQLDRQNLVQTAAELGLSKLLEPAEREANS